ncbi:hypothetical protein VE03_10325 [Pseudogymnoascus sp. 23342-1-I1]|nr:hypothetical protein VE03_10325 [Pseudogymnoascus sp. 23342-1-I1]
MYTTIAISMAQMMRLMFEDDPRKYQKLVRPSQIEKVRELGMKSNASNAETGAAPDEQTLIHREIKRRTAYSFNFGPIINIDDLNVQLPCSEEDFQFGINVKTGSLKDSPGSPDSPDTPILRW